MQTWFWILNALPDGETLFFGLLTCLMLLLVGAIIHRVMGSGSFGPAGNAALVAIGIALAVWVNPRRYGWFIGNDMLQLGGLCAAVSTMVLATAGTLKSWVQHPR